MAVTQDEMGLGDKLNIFRLCEVTQLNPVPVLMSMVIFSNVGGAATPVGDPPNVIIATHPSIVKAVRGFICLPRFPRSVTSNHLAYLDWTNHRKSPN